MFELNRSIKHLNEGFAQWSKAFHLMESIGFYIEKDGFVFLYGKRNRNGASFIIQKKGNDSYNVVALKDNKALNSGLIDMARQANFPESKILDFVLKFAKDRDILKKFSHMNAAEIASLMIQKQGMQSKTFSEIFPEIKHQEGLGSLGLDGMNLIGLDQFKEKDQQRLLKLIEKAISIVRKNGFGHLAYGDVYFVNQAAKKNAAADYTAETDTVRFKVSTRNSDDYTVRAFIHELGHRQYHKFKFDNNALNEKWFEVRDKKPKFEIGTVFVDPDSGRNVVVTDYKVKRGTYDYKGYWEGDDPKKTVTIPYTMAANPNIKIIKGKQPDIDKFHVSNYAMTNPSEFWAEVFSFALTGQDKELMSWVKKVTK